MQVASESEAKPRTARLEARLSGKQKALLQQAAELSGRTLSDFVISSAEEVAARVIQDHETVRLNQAEKLAFVNALLDPPAPGARLLQAATNYRQRVGL